MTSALKHGKFGSIFREKEREKERERGGENMPCNDGGRHWSDAAISQGMSRTDSHHQQLRESQGTYSFSEPSKGTNPTHTLILDI